MKQKILDLRQVGNSYRQIQKILKCSKGIISYYCKGDRDYTSRYSKDNIVIYQNYYDQGFSITKTALNFKIQRATLSKYLILRNKNNKTTKRKVDTKNYRAKTKELAVQYKGGKCTICGYNRCMSSLDFHHLNPKEKDFSISGGTKSFENLKKELDKCILVCRNCHGEIHAGLHIGVVEG